MKRQEAAKPKAEPLVGIILTCLTALLIGGLLTGAGPCSNESDVIPSCFWAWRALLGVGWVTAILAVVRIFETDEGERRGLSFACALLGMLIAAIPDGLIDLCADPVLTCNVAMHPFALCMGVAIALVGWVDLTRRLIKVFNASKR